jgi:hypothetical protein
MIVPTLQGFVPASIKPVTPKATTTKHETPPVKKFETHINQSSGTNRRHQSKTSR